MLSAIISTLNSERNLVPTLSALVPAAAAGLLKEVVVADGGSGDATAEVADIAGCRFESSTETLGIRLKAAAASIRRPWLMFLRAGTGPQPGWIDTAEHFMQTNTLMEGGGRAGVFRLPGAAGSLSPRFAEITALLRAAFGGGPTAEQGLLIARRLYDAVGGHSGGNDADAAILRRVGRPRHSVPPCGINA